MVFSRRELLALLAQGIASRGVRPKPRGKPSGLPWRSQLTDVAREAGLHAPVIYGGVEKKDYIIETAGPGVALLDYDNDGWLDIFLLSTRGGGCNFWGGGARGGGARRRVRRTGSTRTIVTGRSRT